MFEEMKIRYFFVLTIFFSVSFYWFFSKYNLPYELTPEFEITAVLFLGYYFYKYKKSVNDFIDDKDIYRSIPSFLLIAIVINVFSISIMWLQLYLVNFNVPLVFLMIHY